MKVILFIFITSFLVSCDKENEDSIELTEEQEQAETFEFLRRGLATSMVEVNESLKPLMLEARAKKQARGDDSPTSFEDFLDEMPNGEYLSEKGLKLIEASYELQIANATKGDIIEGYDSKELFVISGDVLEGKDINQIMYGDNYENVDVKFGDDLDGENSLYSRSWVSRPLKSIGESIGQAISWIADNEEDILKVAGMIAIIILMF